MSSLDGELRDLFKSLEGKLQDIAQRVEGVSSSSGRRVAAPPPFPPRHPHAMHGDALMQEEHRCDLGSLWHRLDDTYCMFRCRVPFGGRSHPDG